MASTPPPTAPRIAATIGNVQIELIADGPARLTRLIELIDGARHSLRVLFYIFAADGSARQVRDAMARAAERGVRVVALLDSFGSSSTPDSFFEPVRRAGGIVHWFGARWTPRYLIRNHQKLVVVDEHIAMSGGFNVADAYFAPADMADGWSDLALTVTGPAVDSAIRWFDGLDEWLADPRPKFRELRRLVREWRDPGGRVRWLVGGPTVRLSPWARTFRHDLARAGNVALIMAYFSPNAGLLRRFGRISRNGGQVRMLLPARSDNAATVGAARLLYGFLLKRGVCIGEYEPQRLHMKLIVIDDVVLIGSANLDMRSLYMNMEMVLRVRDATFARQCSAFIATQEAQATEITPELHRRRAGLLNRLRWFASWLVVSAIDYSVTRRLNFGLRDD